MKYPEAYIAAIRQVMESMADGDRMRYPELLSKSGVPDGKEFSLWVATAKSQCEHVGIYIMRRANIGIERLSPSESWRILEQRNRQLRNKAENGAKQAQNILREELSQDDRESVRSRWALMGLTAQTSRVPRRKALPAQVSIDTSMMLPPDPYKR